MGKVRCEIISVGTELLLGDILNSNAQYLARGLSDLGLDLYMQTVVGDNEARLTHAVRAAMARAEILLFTGGLGPTQDDLTKEVVARCFSKKLVMDEKSLREIQLFYAINHREMPESNKKQALIPEGAMILTNPQGTAPGCIVKSDEGHTAILMPGPPREMKAMFESQVVPYLAAYSDGVLLSRAVRVISLGESRMAEMLSDLIDNGTNPTLAPYAKDGEAMVRVTARGKTREEAKALTEPVIGEIKSRLGQNVYGVDVPNMETVVAQLLLTNKLSISFLEAGSCAYAAHRMGAVPNGPRMGVSLSAQEFEEIARETGFEIRKELSFTENCAALADHARRGDSHAVVVVISLLDQCFSAAVSMDTNTRMVTQCFPASRGHSYGCNAAAQAAFDLTRLALMDR